MLDAMQCVLNYAFIKAKYQHNKFLAPNIVNYSILKNIFVSNTFLTSHSVSYAFEVVGYDFIILESCISDAISRINIFYIEVI